MKLNKKYIAYGLIGVGVIIAIWYFFFRTPNSGTALGSGTGTGDIDPRGSVSWKAADNQTYAQMVALIPKKDRGWLGDIVHKTYQSQNPSGGNDSEVMIDGVLPKSGALQRAFFTSAPNSGGKYTVHSNGKTFKSIWSQNVYDQMWQLWANFKNSHSL